MLSILGPLCEGAPPAGGGGENRMAARSISGYGKVPGSMLSIDPYGVGADSISARARLRYY